MNTVKVYSEGRAGGLRASSLDFQPYDPELPGGPSWPLLPEAVIWTSATNKTEKQNKNSSQVWLHFTPRGTGAKRVTRSQAGGV